jgi:hypothetical protein
MEYENSQETKDFIDSINDVIKSGRKNMQMVNFQHRIEDEERIYYMESRRQYYPLQLYASPRLDEINGE